MAFDLTDTERAALAALRADGLPPIARRAAVILLSGDGQGAQAIARDVGLSVSTIYYWRREWSQRRMDIFRETAPPAAEDATSLPEAPPGVSAPRLPLELHETVGMLPDDAMAEAGRKALYFNFERMLLHEPVARLGADIEGVHDMRVATRRMRSAFRLFGPFFDPQAVRPLVRGLRRIAAALGEVRDLDVFREKAERFAAKNSGVDLSPLFTTWQDDYDAARAALIEALDAPRFARFVERLHGFVTTPGAGALPIQRGDGIEAYQVRHVAPRLVYEHYERVRAYEALVDSAPIATLHALRIDFKRLRYAMEFFEEVLGPEVKLVIKEIKTMQDHLGDLNDTSVAAQVLNDFITAQQNAHSGVPQFLRPDISGVLAYADFQAAEQQRLLDTFPEAWANFNREEVRRSLALAVSVL
ncbi:MAG: CHAD domain-containing protein [Chloroflexota bacterium]|jgi:CHAD domain-containing protein/transposase-like protein